MLVALAAVLIAFVVLATACGTPDKRLRRYAGVSLALHLLFAFAQYWVMTRYYGIADVFFVAEQARGLTAALDADFFRFAPEVLKLGLHLDAHLATFDVGTNDTMVAITAVLIYACGTLLSSFIVMTVLAWLGQLLMAKTLGVWVAEDDRPIAYASMLLVPSVIFWSAAIIKEGVVVVGLGLLCFAADKALRERKMWYAAGIALGAVPIALVKPYVLFPLVIAVGVWVWTASRAARAGVAETSRTVRFVAFIGGVGVAIGGVVLMGSLFPEFSIEHVLERTAEQQERWNEYRGLGSDVDIGSDASATVGGQLKYVPMALINSLFRPVLFEARNLTMFGAALESTAFLIIALLIARRWRWSAMKTMLRDSPALLASFVFVGLFAVAVGISTSNLGSLSRYRVPMMPFYAFAMAMTLKRTRELAQSPERDRKRSPAPAALRLTSRSRARTE